MKYYITYNLMGEEALLMDGPYEEFEYIYKAIELMNYSEEGIYNLDIVNEIAMDLYKIYIEIENQSKLNNEAELNKINVCCHDMYDIPF